MVASQPKKCLVPLQVPQHLSPQALYLRQQWQYLRDSRLLVKFNQSGCLRPRPFLSVSQPQHLNQVMRQLLHHWSLYRQSPRQSMRPLHQYKRLLILESRLRLLELRLQAWHHLHQFNR